MAVKSKAAGGKEKKKEKEQNKKKTYIPNWLDRWADGEGGLLHLFSLSPLPPPPPSARYP